MRLRSRSLVASLVVAGIAGAAFFIMAERILPVQCLAADCSDRHRSRRTQRVGVLNNGNPLHLMMMKRMKSYPSATRAAPEKFRGDFRGYPENQWIKLVRDNLSVSAAYSTNVVDMGLILVIQHVHDVV